MTQTAPIRPDKRMLYYPLPPVLDIDEIGIHALMCNKDHESTVLFGIQEARPDQIYVCIQSSTITEYKFDDGGWKHFLRPMMGTTLLSKDSARNLWKSLIDSGWTVIPNAT